jgi:hypothetical protein
MAAVLALVACVGTAAGCATGKAQSSPELPALSVPAPPPRVLPPLEGGPIEVVLPPGAESPTATRPQTRHPNEGVRGDAGRSDVKTEPPRSEAPPAENTPTEPPLATEPRGPVPLPPDTETVRAAHGVRQLLGRADRDLNNVDYRALPIDAKSQYDTAKRFMALADKAIKDQNLVFAQTLADKAAAIAAVLSRR